MKYKDEISDWVKKHPGETISREEIPDGFQRSDIIHDWICNHKGEPIPEELMFDDWDHHIDAVEHI